MRKFCVLQRFGTRDNFIDIIKYVLPKLLLGPVYHCLHYVDVLVALARTSENEEDIECISNAKSMLVPLKADIERTLLQANHLKRPSM